MDSDEDLVARIQRECCESPHDKADLCRLIRHPIRNLLDHSGAIVELQVKGAPKRIIGFDIAPRILRALRLAAHTVNGRTFLSTVHANGPFVIHADRLRTFPLGPRLRPLASGHLLLHGHVELAQASRSFFVFTGVRGGSPDRLERVLKDITPSLHRAFLNTHEVTNLAAPQLTHAEKQICRLLLEGFSNKDIAHALEKSEATVRNQLHAIFAKLRVSTRAAATAKLREPWAETLERERQQKAEFIEQLY
jgi:DNA-binding CsgD family transcriptional regulator